MRRRLETILLFDFTVLLLIYTVWRIVVFLVQQPRIWPLILPISDQVYG